MPTMENVDPRIIYAMLKGEPGTRKSTQAVSFPGKHFWFSWDRKMQSIKYPMKLWGIDPKNIEYEDYDDWNKPKNKLEQLQVNCPYDNLVFDSITSCADMILRQSMKMKKGTTRASGKEAGMIIAGIPVNEMEDYNAESSALNELIAITKDIQSYNASKGRITNIILIAHVMDITKQLNNQQVFSRTIVTAGKRVAAKIPAYCSEVYHFGIEKEIAEGSGGELILRTQHTGNDFARTSLGLPAEIKLGSDPLYPKWIAPAIDKLK